TAPGPSFWVGDQIHFAESWVYAASGNETAADRARDDLVRFPRHVPLDYQYEINIQLHQALCTVVQGGTESGAHHATAILHSVPAAYHSNMIIETGRTVIRAVPPQHREMPAVAELREALATTTST